MNNMKQMFHSKFSNLGGKLRLDKNNESDASLLPPYVDSLYISSKIDKEIYYELYKKMSTACVHNYFVLDDKKMKKNSWETLSIFLHESEKKISDDTLTKEVISNAMKAFDDLACNTKEFEKNLSLNVIKYFQDLSEDITLVNAKKALSSLGKDMKANSDKVQFLQDQINNQPCETSSNRKSVEAGNTAVAENKLISAQSIEDNIEKEWEIKKDIYLTKLFITEAETITTAEKIMEFFQSYIDYYTECQKILSMFTPEILTALDKNKHINVFQVPLEVHLAATNRKLSYVLEICIQELDNEETLQHEGLFRISGSKSKLDLLKSALNVMRVDDFVTKGCNSAVYAGVLKQYLRELPVPLMTYELYDKWCEVGNKIRHNDPEGTMPMVKDCLSQLPRCYYDNLGYLMQFLKKISSYESTNKMSASNLGLMLGPNLIRSKQDSSSEDCETAVIMMLGSTGGSVLEFLIAHFNELFADVPIYPTSLKAAVKVSSNASLDEKEPSLKNVMTKLSNDDDSISSGDLKPDDNTGAESNDSLKSDKILKSPSDGIDSIPRSLRKPPVPPPPPQTKSYITEVQPDTFKEQLPTPIENHPVITKRMSKLEQTQLETSKEVDKPQSEIIATKVISRPSQAPSILKRNTTILSQKDSVDRPSRPEHPPPVRPKNPPSLIPPFDKLKENIDTKKENENIQKQSFRDASLSVSIDENSIVTQNIDTKKENENIQKQSFRDASLSVSIDENSIVTQATDIPQFSGSKDISTAL